MVNKSFFLSPLDNVPGLIYTYYQSAADPAADKPILEREHIMKAILLIAMLMLVCGTAWAQPCNCEQTVSVADAACATSNCISLTNCESTIFTASCTGTYTFKVSLTCEGGDCSDANVCGSLYEAYGTQRLTGWHITPGTGQCESGTNYCLTANQSYRFSCCLTPNLIGTGDCPAVGFCTAHTTISYCGPGTVPCN